MQRETKSMKYLKHQLNRMKPGMLPPGALVQHFTRRTHPDDPPRHDGDLLPHCTAASLPRRVVKLLRRLHLQALQAMAKPFLQIAGVCEVS